MERHLVYTERTTRQENATDPAQDRNLCNRQTELKLGERLFARRRRTASPPPTARLGAAAMSDLYSQAGDQWIGMALKQRHMGTTEQALQAYDGAFKRFAETAHSVPLHQEMRKRANPNPNPTPTPNQVPLHQEMRKSYTDLSECPPVDTTVATKLKAQRLGLGLGLRLGLGLA